MSSGIRMSGMVSGLDTEALVQAMVQDKVTRKEKYQKAQTKLEWKQDAYKAINTKVYSLYSKISNLRFTSAYNLKKTTVSDKTKASVTASGEAINGTQTLAVNKLAKSGYLTGAKLEAGTTANSTLKDLGYSDEDTTISVRVGNKNKDITVNGDTKISDLVDQLKKAGVNATFDEKNGRMFVSAKETGKANDFSLTASNLSGLKALSAVGLSVNSAANMETYKASAAYAKGTMGVDDSGKVVSYFQLDKDGNIKYDKEGKALVNEGVTYSVGETKKSIANILNSLKDAKADNIAAKADKNTLNQKIAYSEAKDEIDKYLDDNKETKQTESEELIRLLKYNKSKYSYIDENGEITEAYSIEDQAGKTLLSDRINELAKATGLIEVSEELDDEGKNKEDTKKLDALQASLKKTLAIDDNEILTDDDKAAYYMDSAARDAAKAEDGDLAKIDQRIAANNAVINNSTNQYWDLGDYADVDIDAKAAEIAAKITTAKGIVTGAEGYQLPVNEGATRVDAEDAEITLNGATFTSDSNTFNINGLTIQATGITTEDITISTDVDTQGIYDKVKDFLSEYNQVINELSKLYNADSAKGYEPLTDDQKKEMSDSEVEKWESKVKDALLRKDSTIGGVMNAMAAAMQKSYSINGKNYSLGSFGIQTLGYLNAAKNENLMYHIDGDADDTVSAGKTDKLMQMIQNNPEDTIDFLKELTSGLYKELDKKMKSSTLSSAYTIYNDKQMTKDIDNYKKTVKTWEAKVQDMEDRYYKRYAAMEKQLAKMQSSTSSLTGLFGNN